METAALVSDLVVVALAIAGPGVRLAQRVRGREIVVERRASRVAALVYVVALILAVVAMVALNLTNAVR